MSLIGQPLFLGSHQFVVGIADQATLDKKLVKERPGYKAYLQTTSGLIPMPARK